MSNSSFAKLANYPEATVKRKRLSEALETLSKILDIEFGSLTVHFHNGKCTSKVEIKKNILQTID